MPAIARYSPTGNVYVDGVLSGVKWAVSSLSFSFPTSASFYGASYGYGEAKKGFQTFNEAQQAATRDILQHYSSVINVTFTEMAETSTQHAALRFAESNAPGTAWAYYPSTSAPGGDAWFNGAWGMYDNPKEGNYAWLTLLHEIGHAMGLKHPHEASGTFSKMPAGRDSLEYSVMSYHSYVGSSAGYYSNETWGCPQSLMMYDIAALQKMYGANYTTNSGDTVYKWNPNTGEMSLNGAGQGAPGANRIFLTIWDGGGQDTYDFSNYATDLNVDLQPGAWTTVSTAQLANLGNGHKAAGNIANALLYKNNPASLIEDVVGGSGHDALVGNAADNSLTGGAGNDLLNGLGGQNTAVYSGNFADYSIVENADGSWTVADLRAGSPDGTDQIRNIQLLKFNDVTIEGQPVLSGPPEANDDFYAGMPRKKLVIGAEGVLTNDIAPDSDLLLTSSLVSGPRKGRLVFNEDGSFVYVPKKKFHGIDYFTYKVGDGNEFDLATVWVRVSKKAAFPPAANAPADAAVDGYVTSVGKKLKVAASEGLLANDADADGHTLSVVLLAKPKHGTLTVKANGAFVYVPDKHFKGADSFTYRASDGWSLSEPVKVTIQVGKSAIQPLGEGHDQIPSLAPSQNDDLGNAVQSTLTSAVHDLQPFDIGDQHSGLDTVTTLDAHLLIR